MIAMDHTMLVQLICVSAKGGPLWRKKNLTIGSHILIHGAKVRLQPGYPLPQVRLQLSEMGSMVELKIRDEDIEPDATDVNSKFYATSFEGLAQQQAPLVLNLRGVVQTIVSAGETAIGKPILSFLLQDTRGDVMKVVACGTWAESGEILVGNELLLFFVKSLPPQKSASSVASNEVTNWLYDDGFMHIVRTEVEPKNVGKTIFVGTNS